MGYANRTSECTASLSTYARVAGGRVVLGRMCRLLAIGLIAMTTIIGGESTAQGAEIGAEVTPRVDPHDAWREFLLELIRRMYEQLGGDPAELDEQPVAALGQMEARYRTYGLPSGMTLIERDMMLQDVYACQMHLHDSASPLDESTTQRFLGVLYDMEIDLLLIEPSVSGFAL